MGDWRGCFITLMTSSFQLCFKRLTWRSSKHAFFPFHKVPIAESNTLGPAQILVYLGIEIDVINRMTRLLAHKYKALNDKLKAWAGNKKCGKEELLSLIRLLSFACKVVKLGRIFLRRLIDLPTTVSSLRHHIDIISEGKADTSWWIDFMDVWHGRSFFSR